MKFPMASLVSCAIIQSPVWLAACLLIVDSRIESGPGSISILTGCGRINIMDKRDDYGDKGGLVTASYFAEDLEVFLKEMILIMTLRSAQGVV